MHPGQRRQNRPVGRRWLGRVTPSRHGQVRAGDGPLAQLRRVGQGGYLRPDFAFRGWLYPGQRPGPFSSLWLRSLAESDRSRCPFGPRLGAGFRPRRRGGAPQFLHGGYCGPGVRPPRRPHPHGKRPPALRSAKRDRSAWDGSASRRRDGVPRRRGVARCGLGRPSLGFGPTGDGRATQAPVGTRAGFRAHRRSGQCLFSASRRLAR